MWIDLLGIHTLLFLHVYLKRLLVEKDWSNLDIGKFGRGFIKK